METRAFGKTGLKITPIGFGSWAIGGSGWRGAWGPQDDDEAVGAIRRAVERGINWVDTAAVYGLGHSEELVARALKGLPESERPYLGFNVNLWWGLVMVVSGCVILGMTLASPRRRAARQAQNRS